MHKLMKKTVIYSLLFAVVSITAILYTASQKVIVIADVAQDEVESKIKAETAEKRKEITFAEGTQKTNYLCIPLEEGIRAESVTMENHYMDNELWIAFHGNDMDFYGDNAVTGNRDQIASGYFEQEGNVTWLKFLLTGVYEYRSILEENCLYIEFVPPREVYEKIVVIDPAGGGSDFGKVSGELQEKDITLDIAKRLKEKLDATDIKVYYTRMEDVLIPEEKRVAIANNTKADMLIRIQVGAEEDSGIYGTETVYNKDFFIPGFGSVELADLLEREVVTSISGKAAGLVPAGQDEYVLQEATVPVAAVKVGCITNGQEAILLDRPDYRDKIAEGLKNAVQNAYEKIGK